MARSGRLQVSEGMRNAMQMNMSGNYTEARLLLQHEIDRAATPLAKANAQRARAMSYALECNCAKTVKYETHVIADWITREKEEPKNAFSMQVEMAMGPRDGIRRGRN